MVDCYKDNFEETLNSLLPFLKKEKECEFMAIDFEMTGISFTNKSSRSGYGDLPEERYAKCRPVAMKYSIIQFGVCLFNRADDSNLLEARPFNFYSFPAKGEDLVLSIDAIQFLKGVGMDFNKWITKGVSFVDAPTEEALMAKLEQDREYAKKMAQTDTNRKPVSLSKQADIDYVRKEMERVDAWMLANDGGVEEAKGESGINDVKANGGGGERSRELVLKPCNSFLRRAIFEAIQHKYPKLGRETRNNAVVVLNLTDAEKEERERAKDDERVAKLNETLGLRRLFKAMCEAKVPLVVHNGIYDLMFLMHSFHGPLPESYTEFKAQLKQCFPAIYDTKYMSGREDLHELTFDEGTSVEQLYDALVLKPKLGRFHLAQGFEKYAGVGQDGPKSYAHEAGYDAYLTGCISAAILNKLEPWQRGQLRDRVYSYKSMWECHLAEPEDPLAFQGHLFHIGLAEEAKSVTPDDLKALFTGQHPVNISVMWIDDRGAFLNLNNVKITRDELTSAITPRNGLTVTPFDRWVAMKRGASTVTIPPAGGPLAWLGNIFPFTLLKRPWSRPSTPPESCVGSAAAAGRSPPRKRARRVK